MSSLNPPPFEDAIQDSAQNAMDTSPISQSIDTSFLAPMSSTHPDSGVQPQLMQTGHPNGVLVPMHVSMPDLSSPSFISSMDAIDATAPPIHTAPAAFVNDFVSQPDPFSMVTQVDNPMNLELPPPPQNSHSLSAQSSTQSQMSSTQIHTPVSSYPLGVSSSLDSALDPAGVSTARTHVNPSLPSPTNSISFASQLSQSSMPTAFTNSSSMLTEHLLNSLEPHHVLVPLLKQIALTAESAGEALYNHDDVEATSKVDQLKASISKVSEMLDRLSVSRSDQSRKRCATEMEEGRSVKALKREPEDVTLSLPQINPCMPASSETSPVYPTPVSATPMNSVARPIAPLPHSHSQTSQSRPPSRAPTPPKTSFTNRLSFSPVKPAGAQNFPPFMPPSPAIEYPPKIPSSMGPSSPGYGNVVNSPQWTEQVGPPTTTLTRHHHSLSAGSITAPLQTITLNTAAAAASSFLGRSHEGISSDATSQSMSVASSGSTINPPSGRMSRSGSITGVPYNNTFTYNYMTPDTTTAWSSVPQTQKTPVTPSTKPSSSNWYFGPSDQSTASASPSTTSDVSIMPSTAPHTSRSTPTDPEENDDDNDSDNSENQQKSSAPRKFHGGGPSAPTSSASPDVPAEYRAEVDRIFFEYLNKICSNLDATDSKGEPIHQTLMAKKMQRLDESPDFRPFKFRIQAFTLAFLEELARQGYPEEKIPMKKIRNYLWRQPHILRFNEDGKKAKSKGNHIWNIEAKKAGNGKWEFRPFHRKLAGTPPGVAYCGLKWSWTPHIWDPQASWQNVPVTYSSPNIPSWLSWKDDTLSGIPPPDAKDCAVTVDAKFVIDGQEGHLSHTFNLTIAPVSSIDATSFNRSRRPSMAGEPPKRSTSDSALFQAPQRAKARAVGGQLESADTRVIRVLQTAALRVTEEAQSQFRSSSPPKQNLHDLAKQKHVLDQTVEAYDQVLSGHFHDNTRRLAAAAQNVVVQAAHKVYADRGGTIPPNRSEAAIQSVTVGELTEVTQDAIAKAVKMNGTASTEVDIVVTAAGIIRSESDSGSVASTSQMMPSPIRSHSTGTLSSRLNPTSANGYPTNLSPLPEYA